MIALSVIQMMAVSKMQDISDSILQTFLPPQFKTMSARYKVMCGCECCIYAKSIHASLLSWYDWYLKKLKDQIQNDQNRRSGEK